MLKIVDVTAAAGEMTEATVTLRAFVLHVPLN